MISPDTLDEVKRKNRLYHFLYGGNKLQLLWRRKIRPFINPHLHNILLDCYTDAILNAERAYHEAIEWQKKNSG